MLYALAQFDGRLFVRGARSLPLTDFALQFTSLTGPRSPSAFRIGCRRQKRQKKKRGEKGKNAAENVFGFLDSGFPVVRNERITDRETQRESARSSERTASWDVLEAQGRRRKATARRARYCCISPFLDFPYYYYYYYYSFNFLSLYICLTLSGAPVGADREHCRRVDARRCTKRAAIRVSSLCYFPVSSPRLFCLLRSVTKYLLWFHFIFICLLLYSYWLDVYVNAHSRLVHRSSRIKIISV